MDFYISVSTVKLISAKDCVVKMVNIGLNNC